MIKFLLGFIIGVFFLPTIKEIIFNTGFNNGIRDNILKDPIDFIKEVFIRTFQD